MSMIHTTHTHLDQADGALIHVHDTHHTHARTLIRRMAPSLQCTSHSTSSFIAHLGGAMKPLPRVGGGRQWALPHVSALPHVRALPHVWALPHATLQASSRKPAHP